jgi:hypothetical protein
VEAKSDAGDGGGQDGGDDAGQDGADHEQQDDRPETAPPSGLGPDTPARKVLDESDAPSIPPADPDGHGGRRGVGVQKLSPVP